MSKIARNKSRGFSMLEVLVAVVILSFGLLALATLQVSLMRSSSDTKSRTIALGVAKANLEQMRSFTTLAGYQALTDSGTVTATTIGGVAYLPAWTVQRFIFNEDVDNDGNTTEGGTDHAFQLITPDTGATPGSPTGLVDNNEFKRIKISVTWTDALGVGQSVAMEDAIAALSPSDGALIAKLSSNITTRRIPAIINDPGLDSMVIPIALGGGVNSAATNPKPQVVINNSTVETQFDVYTYSSLSGGTALAQARVETIMLGCTCDFGTADATAFNKRPTYWDGSRYTVPVDASYTAPAGAATAFVDEQSPRCEICCRDHHDPNSTAGATFSPRLVTKSASDIVTSPHGHFADKNSVTAITSGVYKEACRLIRVDGIWRVAADLENDYFALLATGNGTTALTPTPDTTTVLASIPGGAVGRYQQFVLGYLAGRFIPSTLPSDAAAKGVYNTVGTPDTLASSATYLLDSPSSISMDLVDNVAGKWMHSRGMYVDYLEQESVDAIKAARLDPNCTVDTPTLKQCILKLLPFTSINLTEIADWEPAAGTFTVTNLNYSTSLAAGNPVRGQALSNASAAATPNATTKSRKYNTGLLDLNGGFDAISAADNIFLTDTQAFSLGGGGPVGNGPGDGSITVVKGTYAGTNIPSVSSYVTGAAATAPCNHSSGSYACNIDGAESPPGTAISGLGVNGGMSIDVGGYNHQQTVTGASSPVVSNCIGTGNASAATVLPITTSGYTYTGSVCKNYQVSSVTGPATAGAFTWAPAPSSAGDGRVSPTPGEVTRVSFPGYLANTNSVTVNFSLQATTTQTASSCTFVCSNPGQLNPGGTACKNNSLPPIFTVTFPACP